MGDRGVPDTQLLGEFCLGYAALDTPVDQRRQGCGRRRHRNARLSTERGKVLVKPGRGGRCV
jgi:hypothetical protein